MANNLQQILPIILAQGVMALRGACVMPRLVNANYSTMAAEKGAVINVPIPSAIQAQAVSPGSIPPDTADITPTVAQISLSQWYEAPFYLTDNDLMQVPSGTIPMQASEAIKALANYVNAYLLNLGSSFYSVVGTPGATPFASDTSVVTAARKALNRQLAPLTDRRLVIGPDAEANALGLPAFQYYMYSGDKGAMQDGQLGRKFGFDISVDQQVGSFTASAVTNGALSVNGVNAAGSQTVSLAKASNAMTLAPGDVLTISGNPQQYVVTAQASLTAGTSANVSIYPGLAAATAGGELISVMGSHVMNLAFHRDAIAFASRPLTDSAEGLGNQILSASDPVSGLSLRLEVSREHKRTRFSYDILFGAAVVRRELGCRVAG